MPQILHHGFRVVECEVLLAREAAHGQSLRNEPIRNRTGLAIKRFIQRIVKHHCPKADHRVLGRNRPISFDIHDDETHAGTIAT
jgi:hypothetical protein